MSQITVDGVKVSLTPEQLAEAFWAMGDDEQARFFSHLYKTAGSMLCMQMAYVSDRLIEASRHGDYSGWNGMGTIGDHGKELLMTAMHAADREAMLEIQQGVALARQGLQI